MIHDFLSNWRLYFPAEFEVVMQAVESHAQTPQWGEFPINDWAYAKVMTYTTKTADHTTESHKNWVDLQVVSSGIEQIDLYAPDDLIQSRAYSIDDDCIFYQPSGADRRSSVLLTPGMFGLFFPGDVHKTQMASKEPQEIIKIVIKIKYEFFTHRK